MADDLAAKLAHAFTLAAFRAAAQHSDWPMATATEALASELRGILLPAPYDSDPWFVRGLREGAAGEGGGHGLIDIADATAYAEGFAAGRRLADAQDDDVPPDAEDRYSDPGRCAVCGHFLENHQNGPNGDECVCGGCSYYREPSITPDAYACPDWTPDERHRHTIGGQTWEHAHEGGHEAHSAVSHDMSGADHLDPHEPRPEPPSAVPHSLTADEQARLLDAERVAGWARTAAVVSHSYRVQREAVFAMLADGWTITPPADEADDAERARRYALGEEHGAMGGAL